MLDLCGHARLFVVLCLFVCLFSVVCFVFVVSHLRALFSAGGGSSWACLLLLFVVCFEFVVCFVFVVCSLFVFTPEGSVFRRWGMFVGVLSSVPASALSPSPPSLMIGNFPVLFFLLFPL